VNVTRGQKINPAKLAQARKFRRQMTPSERLLWEALRRSALGLHFRRQQIIGGFIADFYCARARLAIEVDGAVHRGKEANDRARDMTLAALGIRTLRFSADAVAMHLDSVIRRIARPADPTP
jgi:very-short-patch-repair endonuclease